MLRPIAWEVRVRAAYQLYPREVMPVPTGKVKWYDADKGFGFLTSDDGGEVFVHSSALPPGTAGLRAGQRVEFGVAEGRKGAQALSLRLLEAPPSVERSVTRASRKKPDEMVVIVEDLIKLLDGISNTYRRGKRPDARDAKKIASVLRAVASDLDAEEHPAHRPGGRPPRAEPTGARR